MKLRRRIESLLRDTMKYSFRPVDGKYPEIDEVEFNGTAEDGGLVDTILQFMGSEVKRAYFAGYKKGGADAVRDVNEVDDLNFVYDPDLADRGAWKGWEVYDRD